MKYTITTSLEDDVLLAKSGQDVQAVLENKIAELVNLGKKAQREEVADAFDVAEPVKKAELEALVTAVKADEEAKALEVVMEAIIEP